MPNSSSSSSILSMAENVAYLLETAEESEDSEDDSEFEWLFCSISFFYLSYLYSSVLYILYINPWFCIRYYLWTKKELIIKEFKNIN